MGDNLHVDNSQFGIVAVNSIARYGLTYYDCHYYNLVVVGQECTEHAYHVEVNAWALIDAAERM